MSASDPHPGQRSLAVAEGGEEYGQMAGEYRLGRKLGEGGFGAVFEAEHPLLKRRAAVKVLHRAAGVNSEAVLRFVSEAQAVNQIRSRHIVDVFSFGRLSDGRHFYVMDLLLGETLDRYRARQGKLDPITTVQLLRPIAAALDTAHAAGIVHRDLKPQNVFLAWDDSGETVPKLLDFGMAKLLSDSAVDTVSGTPLGTPLYMCPEQARGEPVTRRADVYALGVVCHELLTGSPPISGNSAVTVMMAQIVQAPPPVSSVCPELPTSLDTPILRMLEKRPEDRPESASAALQALERALADLGQVVPSGLPRLPLPERDPESKLSLPMSPAEVSPIVALGQMTTEHHPMFADSKAPKARSVRAWWLLAALLTVGAALFLLTQLESPRASDAKDSRAHPSVLSAAAAPQVPASAAQHSAAESQALARDPKASSNPTGARESPANEASIASTAPPTRSPAIGSTAPASPIPKPEVPPSKRMLRPPADKKETPPGGQSARGVETPAAPAEPIPKDLESPF